MRLATLVLHSFVEFGVHIPAIALLATVICAHLSGMGAADRTADPQADAPPSNAAPTRGLAPVLAASAAVGVAFVLGAEGWRAYRVDNLQSSAPPAAITGSTLTPEQILRVEKATRLAPDNASLHLELAQAHLQALEEQKKQLVHRLLVREAAQAVLAFAPLSDVAQGPPLMLTRLPGLLFVVHARQQVLDAEYRHFRPQVSQALEHLVRARNANPLLATANLQLAAHTHELARADSPLVYLDRAKLLAPSDPHLWYLCGLRELTLQLPQRTCSDWRPIASSCRMST